MVLLVWTGLLPVHNDLCHGLVTPTQQDLVEKRQKGPIVLLSRPYVLGLLLRLHQSAINSPCKGSSCAHLIENLVYFNPALTLPMRRFQQMWGKMQK